jgi:hypothetical protein
VSSLVRYTAELERSSAWSTLLPFTSQNNRANKQPSARSLQTVADSRQLPNEYRKTLMSGVLSFCARSIRLIVLITPFLLGSRRSRSGVFYNKDDTVISFYRYHPFAVLCSGTITGVIGELLGRQVRGGVQCQRGGRTVPARGARGASKGVHNASEGVRCQRGVYCQ